jgi:hypothetical protein
MKLSRARTCLLAIGLATFAGTGAVLAAQGNPGIVPSNARITTVKTYADLGTEWWQWAVQAPAADNPLLDKTGEKCRVGQEGPVWFLAGLWGEGSVVRECVDVPGGKALFFPILNYVWLGFTNDPADLRTLDAIRELLSACDDNTIRDVSATIDGVPVARTVRYQTTAEEAPAFQAQLPTDNIFGATGSPPDPDDPDAPMYIPGLILSPSVQKGIYLYVKPLPAGQHTIQWKGTWNCGTQDITYHLTVLPGVAGLVE